MRRTIVVTSLVASAAGGIAWWRRHPRAGSAWVNRVVDPWLVGHGVVVRTQGEIGLIEHVGRTSGITRVSPVHPVPTEDGFRIVVPLGVASQWAANVVAAGRCRLQIGGVVHQLDEPTLVLPSMVEGIPAPAGRVMDRLGFRHLPLRRVAEAPGSLEPARSRPMTDVVEMPALATA